MARGMEVIENLTRFPAESARPGPARDDGRAVLESGPHPLVVVPFERVDRLEVDDPRPVDTGEHLRAEPPGQVLDGRAHDVAAVRGMDGDIIAPRLAMENPLHRERNDPAADSDVQTPERLSGGGVLEPLDRACVAVGGDLLAHA